MYSCPIGYIHVSEEKISGTCNNNTAMLMGLRWKLNCYHLLSSSKEYAYSTATDPGIE